MGHFFSTYFAMLVAILTLGLIIKHTDDNNKGE